MAGESIAIEKVSRRLTGEDASFIYGESRGHPLGPKQFSVGHRCNFCGQEIAYLLPDSPAEAFGVLFQERTFLELRSAEITDPSRQVAEYWYCSDYCARDDLEVRINQREEQMRQHCKPRKKAKVSNPIQDAPVVAIAP
jgi:hypothetical protein